MVTPLTLFIKKRMAEVPLTRKEIVMAMNYKNPSNGYCNLDKWIRGEDTPRHQEDKLANAIQVSRKELDEAIAETEIAFANKRLIAEINYRNKVRETFKPYICAMCEKRVPSPIFAGTFTHSLRFIQLEKSDIQLPYYEFKALIQDKIRAHFDKNEGGIAAFGLMTHYVLRLDYDSPASELMVFDLDGNRVINYDKKIELIHGRPTGMYLK
jgi:hypothetical protein